MSSHDEYDQVVQVVDLIKTWDNNNAMRVLQQHPEWVRSPKIAMTGGHPCSLLRFALDRENSAMVDWLLTHGAPHVDAFGPLVHVAARETQYEDLKRLIQAGADVDVRDKEGCSAAAQAFTDHAMEALLECGADPNGVTNAKGGDTLLVHAVARLDLSVVKVLLEHGADPNKRAGLNGGGALHMLYVNAHDWMRHDASPTDRYDILLKHGADIMLRDDMGATPLHDAPDNPDVIKHLVQAGAVVDAEDQTHVTPLYSHIEGGRLQSAEALIALGANPLHKAKGDTPYAYVRRTLDDVTRPLPDSDRPAWERLMQAMLPALESKVEAREREMCSRAAPRQPSPKL